MDEFLHEVTSTAEEASEARGATCSTQRPASSSSDDSQSQRPTTTRSAICSAASTSDTIGSNEEVHNYEEWELGFENEDDSKALANKDDDDDNDLEASTDSSSPPSSRCSARSREKKCETAPEDGINYDDEEWPSEENQLEPSLDQNEGQELPQHEESHRQCEESKSDIGSARSVRSSSTSVSVVWTNETQAVEDEDESDQQATSRSCDQACGDDSAEVSQSIESVVASRMNSPEERPRDRDHLKSIQRNIQVFVRVRPLPAAQINESRGEMTQVVKLGDEGNSIRVQAPSNHGNNCIVTECNFDKLFMGGSTQKDVFLAVQPSIRASLEGYNATIFAYGQTGTGKTHTIFGEDADINISAAEEKEQCEGLLHSAKPT